MALKFERRHLTFRTWYHKRHWGGLGEITPDEGCCILLETGAPDHILLEDDSGCIEPEDCPEPETDCCILLETGAPDHILLEDDSGCIEPEDCPDADASEFLFLSDPADGFEFLEGTGSVFEFLE